MESEKKMKSLDGVEEAFRGRCRRLKDDISMQNGVWLDR